MKKEIILTSEILEANKQNPNFIKAVASSHKCCDKNGIFLHFKSLVYPLEYITTEEQKNEAISIREQQKSNFKNSINNKLVFVGMGCEYNSRFENDICNHRVRTEIQNPKGRNFFIEVSRGKGEKMNFDFVIDRDQEDEYKNEAQRIRTKINESNFNFQSHPLYKEYQKYMGQPYYWYNKNQWHSLNIEYTTKNLLKVVNDLFECNFKNIQIDNVFLSTDEFKSISPN